MVFIIAEEQLKPMQRYVQVKFNQILMILLDILARSLLFVYGLEGLLGLKDAIGNALKVLQESFENVTEEGIEERLQAF